MFTACSRLRALATAIDVPLLAFLMLSFGSRWMFAIMGVFGLLVAALWYPVYRNPLTSRSPMSRATRWRLPSSPPRLARCRILAAISAVPWPRPSPA